MTSPFADESMMGGTGTQPKKEKRPSRFSETSYGGYALYNIPNTNGRFDTPAYYTTGDILGNGYGNVNFTKNEHIAGRGIYAMNQTLKNAGDRVRNIETERFQRGAVILDRNAIKSQVAAVNQRTITSPFVVGNKVAIEFSDAHANEQQDKRRLARQKRMMKAEDGIGPNATKFIEMIQRGYPTAPQSLLNKANDYRNLTKYTGINTGPATDDNLLSIRGGRFVVDDGERIYTLENFSRVLSQIDSRLVRVLHRYPLVKLIKALRSFNKAKNKIFKYVRADELVGIGKALSISGDEWAQQPKKIRAAINTLRQAHAFNKPYLTYKQAAWRDALIGAMKTSKGRVE